MTDSHSKVAEENCELKIEEFCDKLAKESVEEAVTEAFIQGYFENKNFLKPDKDISKLKEEEVAEVGEDEEDFDSKTLIEKCQYFLRKSDHFLNRYMWIIAIIWLLVVSIRWIGSATIQKSPNQKSKQNGQPFRTSNGQLLTRLPSPPTPFFPNYSRDIIDDHYFGNHAKPSDLLQRSEISILMFYAPWSLHSQEAKKPFMDVATAFSFMPTVRFSAVNCFTKYGACKRQYKLYSYPIIVGYIGNIQISYPGTPSTVGLFRFVKHLVDPADKVSSMEELNKMFGEFEHVIVGYFPFENNQRLPEYSTFIATAMKSASYYLFESARFVAIQNPALAQELSMDYANRIRILTKSRIETPTSKFNISSSFLLSKHTKSDDILEWAKEKISTTERAIVEWLHLELLEAGGKSETLQLALAESNSLILFTTDYGNAAQTKALKLIQQAAISYFSCNNTVTLTSPKLDSEKIEEAQRGCRKLALNPDQIEPCCQQIVKSGACSTSTNSSVSFSQQSEGEYCSAVLKVIPAETAQKFCCFSSRPGRRSKSINYVNWEDELSCEWYRLMKRTNNFPQHVSKSQISHHSDFAEIQGLGCSSNETMKFYAACRTHNHQLLKKLNFENETKQPPTDKLVIVSLERESMHLLDNDDEITSKSISKFLIDFHHQKLKTVKMNEKNVKKDEEKAVQTFQKLNSLDFENFLGTKRKHDSVVFFTGGRAHGASASISYILHTVASYFSDFNDLIKFYLIDASANDLPFQYTFDRLPALVFIPPLHSSIGGARYPHNLPISVPNLLAFLLSRSQPELRWRISLASCSSECLKRNRLELHRFLSQLDLSIRKLRISRTHLIRSGHGHDASIQAAFIRSTLHRRILQRTSATHLDNMLQLLSTSSSSMKKMPLEETNKIIKQSLFIRWILYNHFGL